MEKQKLEALYKDISLHILADEKLDEYDARDAALGKLLRDAAMKDLSFVAFELAEERYGRDGYKHAKDLAELMRTLAEFADSDYKFVGIIKLLGFKVE